MTKQQVLVTFDSMKYPNTGLFSFGKSLGNTLINQNKGKYSLYYYVHQKAEYLFEKKVNLVFLSKLHKLFFPEPNRFSLVHFTDQYCRLRPQKVNAKKILTIHDLNPLHENFEPIHKTKKYIEKLGRYISKCDRIVAISKFVAADIVKNFPEAAHKLSVIYNGADVLKVDDNHQPKYVPQKPFLFTIGFVGPKKNFHVLPALLQNNDYELVIAGIETPYKDKIMEEANKFGCADRVKIIGTVSDDDRTWYYKNCAAFVFPSLAEGFGLPVIEAMHFGKPVFLSTATSLPEIGGDAAFYFDSFAPAAMQQVFEDSMKRFPAENGPEKVKANAMRFNWDNTAKQYLALYDECLKK